MADNGQIPFFLRPANRLMRLLVRAGVPVGNTVLLTVRGRKSCQPYTNPVTILHQDGQRYIIAAYGMTSWVRNLRAAGTGELKHGRHSETIVTTELAPEAAAPLLKHGLTIGPSMLRRYFDASPTSPVEEFVREALRHPVFAIQAVPSVGSTNT